MVLLWKNYVILIEFNSPRVYLPDEEQILPRETGRMESHRTRDQATQRHK